MSVLMNTDGGGGTIRTTPPKITIAPKATLPSVSNMLTGQNAANLKYGATGSTVKDVQTQLTNNGYNVGPTGADGVYGNNTEAAVRQYQKDQGLPISGVVDKGTQAILSGQGQQQTQQQTQVQSTSQPDSILQSILGLLQQPSSPYNITPFTSPQIPILTQDEAMAQALAQLNPQFEQAVSQLTKNLDLDQERRGFFFSPAGSTLSSDAQAGLKGDQQIALSQLAQQLITQSKADAQAEEQQAFNEWQAQQGLGLQAAGFNADQNNNKFSQLMNYQNYQAGREDAEFTRTMSNLNAAMQRVGLMGGVMNANDAQLLGVPVGTTSWEAKNAADQRAFEAQEAAKQRSFTASQNSLSRSASSGSDNFNKLMTVWKATGKAPSGLQGYGIQPGEVYYQSAADQVTEYEAGQKLNSYSKQPTSGEIVTTQKTYGVDANTAEDIILVLRSPNKASALSELTAAYKAAKSNGQSMDYNSVLKAINGYWPEDDNNSSYVAPGVSGSTWNSNRSRK